MDALEKGGHGEAYNLATTRHKYNKSSSHPSVILPALNLNGVMEVCWSLSSVAEGREYTMDWSLGTSDTPVFPPKSKTWMFRLIASSKLTLNVRVKYHDNKNKNLIIKIKINCCTC